LQQNGERALFPMSEVTFYYLLIAALGLLPPDDAAGRVAFLLSLDCSIAKMPFFVKVRKETFYYLLIAAASAAWAGFARTFSLGLVRLSTIS